MKRQLTLFIVFALVLTCAPVIPLQVQAASAASGTCGDNLTWELDVAGTLTVSGTSAMNSSPWDDYSSVIQRVVIESGTTSIVEEAFRDCTSLTSIEIPDSVTSIGESAFNGCSSLTHVVLPKGVINIDKHTFRNCSNLESVVIPNSVTTISNYAFYNCIGLKSVAIPDSVTDIGEWAFYRCISLTSVVIPDSVTSIGIWAFASCSSLTKVKISDSITAISYSAFRECSSLKNLGIPDGVTQIGESAFYNCSSLTNVVIPNGVKKIGRSAFYKSNGITTVYYSGTETQKNNITTEMGNDPLTKATWIYKATPCLHIADDGAEWIYATLEEAILNITSGEIHLLTHTAMDTVILKPNVTLDLNGHMLTANLLVAMNGAKVTGDGVLKIAKENLVLDQDNGGVIPVWNGVDGYLFTKVTYQQMAIKAGEGAAQYIFLPAFSNAEAAVLLADGGADHAIKIKVGLDWNDGQCQQFYTYEEAFIEQVFASNGGLAFSLTVTGISGITDMTASAVIVTDTYAQATATSTALVAG